MQVPQTGCIPVKGNRIPYKENSLAHTAYRSEACATLRLVTIRRHAPESEVHPSFVLIKVRLLEQKKVETKTFQTLHDLKSGLIRFV